MDASSDSISRHRSNDGDVFFKTDTPFTRSRSKSEPVFEVALDVRPPKPRGWVG